MRDSRRGIFLARDRKQKGWLASLLGGRDDPPGTRYELVVLDGADAGCRYPIDQPQVQIGRRVPGSMSDSGIELNDKSVSGRHAIIGFEQGRVTVEHLPSATNPTLVNGRRVTRKRLRDGDRIVLGLVVLELRALRPEASDAGRGERSPFASPQVATDPVNARAELLLREGIDDLLGARFPLVQRRTSIGRDEDCDITLDVASVSRNHAALVWEDEQLVLIHESAVNPTHVNGMQVRDRRRVFQGDEIRLSERVAFEVLLEASDAAGRVPQAAAALGASEEATRLTSPPGAAARGAGAQPHASPNDAERTHVTPLPVSAQDDADATRITPIPVSADAPADAAEDDAAATRITPIPGSAGAPEAESPLTGDSDATRIDPIPSSADDAAATRITPLPGSADAPEAESPPEEADLTRIAGEGDAPAPVADAPEALPGGIDRGRFAAGDATQIAPAPDRSRYADADVTRIAPVPTGAASSPATPPGEATAPPTASSEATRVVDLDELHGGPDAAADSAKTQIRPSPLADSERTIVRRPSGPPDDAAATLIRPRPGEPEQPRSAGPAETVVFEPDDDEEEEEEGP